MADFGKLQPGNLVRKTAQYGSMVGTNLISSKNYKYKNLVSIPYKLYHLTVSCTFTITENT